MSTKHVFGWNKEIELTAPIRPQDPISKVGATIHLCAGFPLKPFNQGQLGDCVANAIIGAITFDQKKQGLTPTMLSRLFLYYNGRAIENTVSTDSGLTITDGVNSYNRFGCPPETLWPYDIAKFKQKPPPPAYADAQAFGLVKQQAVPQTAGAISGVLQAKLPVVIGFQCFQEFESDEVAATGIVPMPKSGQTPIGGHCVALCGEDEGDTYYHCRNSYGHTNWGIPGWLGYFVIPKAYILNPNLASDFRTIEAVR